MDTLVDNEIISSYAWKDVTVIPRRILPARALVVALSPLLDARGITALLDLRARGFDLVVLEVSSEPYLAAPADRDAEQGRRLWRLQRAALRARLERAGVAVATVGDPVPLTLTIGEVTRWRRYAARTARRSA